MLNCEPILHPAIARIACENSAQRAQAYSWQGLIIVCIHGSNQLNNVLAQRELTHAG